MIDRHHTDQRPFLTVVKWPDGFRREDVAQLIAESSGLIEFIRSDTTERERLTNMRGSGTWPQMQRTARRRFSSGSSWVPETSSYSRSFRGRPDCIVRHHTVSWLRIERTCTITPLLTSGPS